MNNITAEHMRRVEEGVHLWAEAGGLKEITLARPVSANEEATAKLNAQSLADEDPLANMEALISVLRGADEMCSSQDLASKLKYVFRHIWKYITHEENKEQIKDIYKLDQKQVNKIIHTQLGQFEQRYKKLLSETLCPSAEIKVGVHLAKTQALIAEWEDAFNMSYFLMLEQKFQHGPILGVGSVDDNVRNPKVCHNKARLEAAREKMRVARGTDEWATESHLTMKEAWKSIKISQLIEEELTKAEFYLEMLYSKCKTNFAAKVRDDSTNSYSFSVRRMFACDPFLITRARWHHAGVWFNRGAKIVDGFMKYVMAPLADVTTIFKSYGVFATGGALEIVNLLSFILLRAYTNQDPAEVCVRLAQSIGSGQETRPITGVDLSKAIDQSGLNIAKPPMWG